MSWIRHTASCAVRQNETGAKGLDEVRGGARAGESDRKSQDLLDLIEDSDSPSRRAMRRNWCPAFNAARSQWTQIRRWAWVWAFAASLGVMAEPAQATGLRMGVRVEQELHAPLVPVTKNFRVCFELDDQGVPTLRLCPAAPGAEPPVPPLKTEERAPALAPTGSASPKIPSK